MASKFFKKSSFSMKELFYGTTNCKKDYVDYMKIIL